MKELTYLACPYSHSSLRVRKKRFETVTMIAADMMKSGKFVYSPITHSHPMAVVGGLPGNWEFWKDYDEAFMACCGKMVVLMLDGWEESHGVRSEIELAENKYQIPVEYIKVYP